MPKKHTDIKRVRERARRLKKVGLIKSIPRQINPGTRAGHKFVHEVEKWDDVLSGKASVVSVPKSKLQKVKRQTAGSEVHRGKLVIPTAAGERAFYDKKTGLIGRDLGPGTKELQFDGNLDGPEFKKFLDKLPDAREDEFYGFKLGGHDGSRYFKHGDQMRRFFAEHYRGPNDKSPFGKGSNMVEAFRIFRINRKAMARAEEKFRR